MKSPIMEPEKGGVGGVVGLAFEAPFDPPRHNNAPGSFN